MKHHKSDVFVNGEWRCGHISASRKTVLDKAKHHAAWMLEDEATIARTLKIRDRTVVEIKVDGKAIRG